MDDIDAARDWFSICALDLLDDITDELRKLKYGELVAVADVDGASLGRVHERDQSVYQVVNVLERACL